MANFDPANPAPFTTAIDNMKAANHLTITALCAIEDSLKATKGKPDAKAAEALAKEKAEATATLQALENADANCYNRPPTVTNTGCGGPCGWDFVVASCLGSKEGAEGSYGGVVGIEKFTPYVICLSNHKKGMSEDGLAIHHDMMSGEMNCDHIFAVNQKTKDFCENKNADFLFTEMKDLVTDFSFSELEAVNLEMVDKFKSNSGGEFRSLILNKKILEHEHTQVFIDRIRKNFENRLSGNSAFVYEKKSFGNQDPFITKIGTKIQRIDIPSPTYPDKLSGLGIAINDTWGYEIKITDFKIDRDKHKYSATFEIEIFDHYGLNSPDIDPRVNGGTFDSANFEGFWAWFILQHSERFAYKPFITLINLKLDIKDAIYKKHY